MTRVQPDAGNPDAREDEVIDRQAATSEIDGSDVSGETEALGAPSSARTDTGE
ncbi:MAG: hypothetical protein H0U16_08785, partial [Actinobacteria bacterium]|nr:hypothetical protein [Actinomycetota bacterium]